MARATIGESGSDKAMNRMEKHLDRSARRGDTAAATPTLLDQIKATYPDSWRQELREMKREKEDPDYLLRKTTAREQIVDAYWKIGRVERENMGITPGVYIARKMRVWLEDNK